MSKNKNKSARSGSPPAIAPIDRAQGCLVGLAVGDALGTTLEFTPMLDPYQPSVTTIVGGGPFKLPKGAWTDDTSMALCLILSLIECKAFDPADHMRRYVSWRDDGYMASVGWCFDIGGTVNRALNAFQQTGEPYSGSTSPQSSGNGALMRMAPIAIVADSLEDAERLGRDMSRTTHGSAECLDAAGYFAGLLWLAINGATKYELFQYRPEWVTAPAVKAVINGSYKDADAYQRVRGNGYVVNALEAALWCFWNSTTVREALILAVNLGEDTDTTGAITGQLVGAHYGLDAIPHKWRKTTMDADHIADLAQEAFALRGTIG